MQVHLTQKISPPPPPPPPTATIPSNGSSLFSSSLIPPPSTTILPSSSASSQPVMPAVYPSISSSSSIPIPQSSSFSSSSSIPIPQSPSFSSSSSIPIPQSSSSSMPLSTSSLPLSPPQSRPSSIQLSYSLPVPSCSSSRPSSIQVSSTPISSDRQSVTPTITETSESGSEKPQPESNKSKDYSQYKTVNELLECLGLQEYEGDFAQLPVVEVSELFMIKEDKLKTFMKFGHRKRLIDTLCQIDPLYSFLTLIDHHDYYEKFKDLGFDSIWSLLGITKECQSVFELNDEEMDHLLEKKEKFMKDNTPDIDNMKELIGLKEDSDSEPILCIFFSEETATRLKNVII